MIEQPESDSPPLRPHLSGLAAGALMARALEDFAPGTPWPDGYERVSLLGAGGMGEVHLARDPALGREVAIKLVLPDLHGEPMILERLQREARAMSKLDHPGIVTIHRLVPFGEESAAIVMEYVDGGNLRDLIRKGDSPIPVAEALRIIRETASAIHAAHQLGIVHRDLKPENILLTADGRAKVTDFGLAAPLDPDATRITLSGTTAGTADYMAPERYLGNDAGVSGDIYSLGVILYELLTGKPPRGNFDPPSAVRKDVPKPVGDAVMRALKNDPARRFATMAEFAAALENRARRRAPLLLLIPAAVLIALAVAPHLWSPKLTAESAPAPEAALPLPETPAPGAWRDLLATADPTRDVLSGSWKMDTDGLSSSEEICIFKLVDEMPAAYDVRITFTRLSGVHSIALFFQTANGTGSIDIDGWGLSLSGVQSIDGRDLRDGNAFPFALENGRSYELLARIRPDTVTISIDGAHKITTPILGRNLGIVSPWAWNPAERPAALAIGSYESATRFSSVKWREVP